MQELKTVNWNFQVTLCPFSLPTLLFTPEARIGKSGVCCEQGHFLKADHSP